MNTIAVIPARGGSKGLPRKNLRMLCGLPLVVWAIRACKRASQVDVTCVSTEDSEIASVARAHGAHVIERPLELASDTASSEEVVAHAIQTFAPEPQNVLLVQCTSPLTTAADIDDCVEMLANHDHVFTAAPFDRHVWRGAGSPLRSDSVPRRPRQEHSDLYVETGGVYAMRVELFLQENNRFCGSGCVVVVPPHRALDIDTGVDLLLAEVLMREHISAQRATFLPVPCHAVVTDFDGVHTNNRFWMFGESADVPVCNRADGLAIERLRNAGIPVHMLSGCLGASEARARKLGMTCDCGPGDKLPRLVSWLSAMGIDPSDVVYVGNDVNDAGCLSHVGCGVVPADAHHSVIPLAKIKLDTKGGDGVLREIVDLMGV